MSEPTAEWDRGTDANRIVTIRRALSENTLTTPKSGSDRQVPISPELHVVLKEAVRHKLPQARIILTKRGTTPGRTFVLAKLRKFQRDNNLQDRSFHSLRHFFCSTLMRVGANPEAVRVLAGHSSLAVTQRYLHATRADIASAFAKLAGN